jgi:hypothetical protein
VADLIMHLGIDQDVFSRGAVDGEVVHELAVVTEAELVAGRRVPGGGVGQVDEGIAGSSRFSMIRTSDIDPNMPGSVILTIALASCSGGTRPRPGHRRSV